MKSVDISELCLEDEQIIAACKKVKFIKNCSECGKGLEDDDSLPSLILVNKKSKEQEIKSYRFCNSDCMEKWNSRGY